MATVAEYEQELVDALNLLIEDERASVEMEVALASGATEYAERDTLAHMGSDDISSCETLRAEMENAGLPVTPQINGVVFEVLGAERYDDRLRAFAHHQRLVAERAGELLESNLDGELREALITIVETHQRHIAWAHERADTFAASRLLEFGPRRAAPVEPEAAESEPDEMNAPDEATDEVAGAEAAPVVDAALPVIAPVETPTELTVEAATAEVEPEAAPDAVVSAPKRAAPRKRATPAKTSTPKTTTPKSTTPSPRLRAPRTRKPPTPPAE